MAGTVKTILPGQVQVSGPVGIGTSPRAGDDLTVKTTGIRDNSGTMQVKNSTGDWFNIPAASSSTEWQRNATVLAVANAGDSLIYPPDKGGQVHNVKAYGATGDGTTDDTAAIQAALTVAAVAGGTVVVPPGTYLVNGDVTNDNRDADTGGLLVGSNTTLVIMPGATLKQETSASQSYHMLRVGETATNVCITGGGTIQGDRDTHDYTGGTHEWGYGIFVVNGVSNVTIDTVTIRDCTGDGISIHDLGDDATRPHNVRIEAVTSTNNRRHGLAVIGVHGLTVAQSTFSATNGTAPSNGAAVEPGGFGHAVLNASFIGCTYTSNAGRGFVAQGSTGTDVAGLSVLGGVAANNTEGVGLVNVTGGAVVSGVTASGNGAEGIFADAGTANASIVGNYVIGNSQTTDNTSAGIRLQATSTIFVAHNVIRHGGGAKQQKYGFQCLVATDTYAIGNDLYASGKTGALDDYMPTRGRHLFYQRLAGGLAVGNVATYADNAAATAGGLTAGDLYRTATGVVMTVY